MRVHGCRLASGPRFYNVVALAVGSRLVRNVVCVSPVQFCTEICAHARQPCHEKKPLSNAAGAFNMKGSRWGSAGPFFTDGKT